MGVDPKKVRPVTKTPVTKVPKKPFDPGRVFYRVAVIDAIKSGDRAELTALVEGLRGLKSEYGGMEGTIKAAEAALGRAKST